MTPLFSTSPSITSSPSSPSSSKSSSPARSSLSSISSFNYAKSKFIIAQAQANKSNQLQTPIASPHHLKYPQSLNSQFSSNHHQKSDITTPSSPLSPLSSPHHSDSVTSPTLLHRHNILNRNSIISYNNNKGNRASIISNFNSNSVNTGNSGTLGRSSGTITRSVTPAKAVSDARASRLPSVFDVESMLEQLNSIGSSLDDPNWLPPPPSTYVSSNADKESPNVGSSSGPVNMSRGESSRVAALAKLFGGTLDKPRRSKTRKNDTAASSPSPLPSLIENVTPNASSSDYSDVNNLSVNIYDHMTIQNNSSNSASNTRNSPSNSPVPSVSSSIAKSNDNTTIDESRPVTPFVKPARSHSSNKLLDIFRSDTFRKRFSDKSSLGRSSVTPPPRDNTPSPATQTSALIIETSSDINNNDISTENVHKSSNNLNRDKNVSSSTALEDNITLSDASSIDAGPMVDQSVHPRPTSRNTPPIPPPRTRRARSVSRKRYISNDSSTFSTSASDAAYPPSIRLSKSSRGKDYSTNNTIEASDKRVTRSTIQSDSTFSNTSPNETTSPSQDVAVDEHDPKYQSVSTLSDKHVDKTLESQNITQSYDVSKSISKSIISEDAVNEAARSHHSISPTPSYDEGSDYNMNHVDMSVNADLVKARNRQMHLLSSSPLQSSPINDVAEEVIVVDEESENFEKSDLDEIVKKGHDSSHITEGIFCILL